MFNFVITILFAAVMFILGDAVGVEGVASIYQKIISLFS